MHVGTFDITLAQYKQMWYSIQTVVVVVVVVVVVIIVVVVVVAIVVVVVVVVVVVEVAVVVVAVVVMLESACVKGLSPEAGGALFLMKYVFFWAWQLDVRPLPWVKTGPA